LNQKIKKKKQSLETFSLSIPISPVPASRPRVTRWATYYGKRHTQYVKDSAVFFKGIRSRLPIAEESFFNDPVAVELKLFVTRPKTTKRLFPVGDVDNYAKIILDELVKYKILYDDDLILKLKVTKQFADNFEGTKVEIYKL